MLYVFDIQWHFNSGNVHRNTFLFAKFLNLKYQGQWKWMWCDVADVFIDKYSKLVCWFLLLYCKEGCWSVRSIATTHEAKCMTCTADAEQKCVLRLLFLGVGGVGTTTDRLLLVWLLRSTVLNQGISKHMFLISKSLFLPPQPFLKVCLCYLVPPSTANFLGLEENLGVPL